MGVASFPFRRVAEQAGDFGAPLNVGGLGEVLIATVGLSLASKGVLRVFLRLATFQLGHVSPSCWVEVSSQNFSLRIPPLSLAENWRH